MADNWIPLPPRTDGLEVLEDGTMMFHGLRAQEITFTPLYSKVPGPNLGKLLDLRQNKIRLTVALPLDHTVIAGAKIAGSNGDLPVFRAPGTTAETIQANAYPRQHYVKSPKYEKWMRKGSWPVPESIYNPSIGDYTKKATDKPGTIGVPSKALRDDTPLAQNEANRNLAEVGRMQGTRNLILKGINFVLMPGDEIKDVSGANVDKVIHRVIIHCGEETQHTELILG